MRLIVDAQLPKRLARWLADHGHDVLHALDLPEGNRTPDTDIIDLTFREGRVVVSKDADFVDSHRLQKRVPKLAIGGDREYVERGSRNDSRPQPDDD